MEKDAKMFLALLVGTFLYALISMTVAREFVIPLLIPQSVDGHIPGDPAYYWNLAQEQFNIISMDGLGSFVLHPSGQGPAGIASLLLFLYNDIYAIVIFNSLLHAISCCFLFLILRTFFSNSASLISIIPFIISLNMIYWLSQLNKESLVICGVMIYSYFLLKFVLALSETKYKNLYLYIFGCILGSALTWVSRPHVNTINNLSSILLFIYFIIISYRYGQNLLPVINPFIAITILIFFNNAMSSGAASSDTINGLISGADFNLSATSIYEDSDPNFVDICLENTSISNWLYSPLVPSVVEANLRALMSQRCLTFNILFRQDLITSQYSVVDSDILPSGTVEAILYIPRSIILGFFYPTPWSITYAIKQRPSVFYTIAPIETVAIIFGVISVIFWLLVYREWKLLIPIFLCLAPITLFAMSTPLIGTLYRYRYPWWLLLICIGVAASVDLFLRFRAARVLP